MSRRRARPRDPAAWLARAGIPLVMIAAGIAVALSDWRYGDGMAVVLIGGAAAIALLGWFFRIGTEGDRERDHEEEARRHLDRTGRWPDEP